MIYVTFLEHLDRAISIVDSAAEAMEKAVALAQTSAQTATEAIRQILKDESSASSELVAIVRRSLDDRISDSAINRAGWCQSLHDYAYGDVERTYRSVEFFPDEHDAEEAKAQLALKLAFSRLAAALAAAGAVKAQMTYVCTCAKLAGIIDESPDDFPITCSLVGIRLMIKKLCAPPPAATV